jgi:hypothetical protein
VSLVGAGTSRFRQNAQVNSADAGLSGVPAGSDAQLSVEKRAP